MTGAIRDQEAYEMETQTRVEEKQTLHVPNFISITQNVLDFNTDDLMERRLTHLRKTALKNDEENLMRLKERAQSPHDLKWQTYPLIEARIFHCRGFGSSQNN